ncbi:hypothetical protein BV25DRAFT_1829659 [Artomyces pyxidatus]|uniref:Uncharacterized protein n=1 Tax=Artomyces pyxidatus TaxID=48021 RepID=A0ACB8SQX9_9AGAM|nr:hypothetical protein BV25DRAFT_1829659 [Artomyces pyxidatus]
MSQEDGDAIDPLSMSATTPTAPVHRLPPEIVAAIFSTYASLGYITFTKIVSDYEGDSLTKVDKQVGWINVTHVCRRWREIALGHATLWSSIDCTVPRPWREEMLHRSAACPVSLDLNANVLDIAELQRFVLENIPRFMSLSISYGSARSASPEFLVSLTHPSTVAPRLESLSLFGFIDWAALDITVASFPVLRSLKVIGLTLSLTSSVLKNLAHFHLDRAPARQLYAALTHMEKLETIFAVLVDHPPLLSPEPPTVSLPRLTSLNISSFRENSLDLASRLIIPVTAKVTIGCQSAESHHFIHPIMRLLGGSSRPPRAIFLEAHLKLQLQNSKPRSRTTTFQFLPHLSWENGRQLLCGRTALWGGICLDALTHLSLRLDSESVWTKHRWLANFRHAQSVSAIHVHGAKAVISLLNALAEPIADQDVLPPSIQSDASLVPYLHPGEPKEDFYDVLPDVQWSGAEPDARLFPHLDTIVVEHIENIYLRHRSRPLELRSDSIAIIDALADRLQSRQENEACPVKMVEVRLVRSKEPEVMLGVVDRLKQCSENLVLNMVDSW